MTTFSPLFLLSDTCLLLPFIPTPTPVACPNTHTHKRKSRGNIKRIGSDRIVLSLFNNCRHVEWSLLKSPKGATQCPSDPGEGQHLAEELAEELTEKHDCSHEHGTSKV